MIITELYIKHFGKFSEQRISFHDGVQVIYGENEFGKTTIHAFIRAMLFGMERGRGKAAAKDNYSRYEPWDHSGEYGGMMRFTCGGRNFRLERSFDRFSRHAYLICENDGEELSVEQGDLEMLMGGLTPALFDSTVSIGQLMIRPGQELADALRNYAVNDYESGSGEIDLNQALSMIDKKRKETERALKAEEQTLEEGRKRLEQECAYLEREMDALREEFTEKQGQKKELMRMRAAGQRGGGSTWEETKAEKARDARLKSGLQDAGQEGRSGDEDISQKGERNAGSLTSGKLFKSGAGAFLAAAAGMIWSTFAGGGIWQSAWVGLSVLSIAFLIIGIICIAAGVRWKILESRHSEEDPASGEKQECQRKGSSGNPGREQWERESTKGSAVQGDNPYNKEAGRERNEEAERIRRLDWEMEWIQREWKEKEIRCSNLREELDEQTDNGSISILKRRIQALELARESLTDASKQGNRKAADRVSRRASEIFCELTDGRYRQIDMDSRMELSVWDGHRRIPAERLSRGTLEQIYFSLRMASADVMQEEIMPVILDDTFVFYDENRLKSALKWLSRQERQVIILSCNKRERDLLREEYDT